MLDSSKAIQVDRLTVEYKRTFKKPVLAVNNISFSVNRSEIVGFIGLNGAGKTSTIKTLMGFQPLADGSATIFGKPVGSVEAKLHIGFLPETALYSPYLTPIETLTQFGELHGFSGETLNSKINDLLERVQLSHKAKTLNKNLSKGMLQRVGIAQSLISNPDLLILDEVSSGLDPIGRRDLRLLLKNERERGATIFFSSHSLSEVEMLCDRVILIHQGHIISEKSIHELVGKVDSLEDYFVNLVESGADLIESSRSAA